MAETEVTIGYGSTYEISTNGGSTWVEVDEITNITPPSFTVDTPEGTHMKSPNRTREFVPSMIDPGEASMTINYIPGSDSDVLLKGLQVNGTRFSARETYPNGVTSTYSGIVSGLTGAVPLDDKMTMDVTIKVASAVTSGAAVAPANTALPAISGFAQVGEELTAWHGIWSGAPSYSYQWEADGTPIGGATARTYTPVIGQIGDVITVVVTATNAHSAVSAESVGTAAVIAA